MASQFQDGAGPISIIRGWQGRWRHTAPTALFFVGSFLIVRTGPTDAALRLVTCFSAVILRSMRPPTRRGAPMSAEPALTSDVIGLTKVAPFSRRGFMTASAAVTAGYTLAAGAVRAEVITTDTNALNAGDAKVKVADG